MLSQIKLSALNSGSSLLAENVCTERMGVERTKCVERDTAILHISSFGQNRYFPKILMNFKNFSKCFRSPQVDA